MTSAGDAGSTSAGSHRCPSPSARRASRSCMGVYVGLSLAMDPHRLPRARTPGPRSPPSRRWTAAARPDPDVGYWAEAGIPTDPFTRSTRRRNSRTAAGWRVTTLPLIEAARPLYAAGGYRPSCCCPCSAPSASAFARRSVARRSRATRRVGRLLGGGALLTGASSTPSTSGSTRSGVACIVARWRCSSTRRRRAAGGRALAAGRSSAWRPRCAPRRSSMPLSPSGSAAARRCGASARPPLSASAWPPLVGFAASGSATVALEGWVGGLSRATRARGAATSARPASGDRLAEAMHPLWCNRRREPRARRWAGWPRSPCWSSMRADRRGEVELAWRFSPWPARTPTSLGAGRAWVRARPAARLPDRARRAAPAPTPRGALGARARDRGGRAPVGVRVPVRSAAAGRNGEGATRSRRDPAGDPRASPRSRGARCGSLGAGPPSRWGSRCWASCGWANDRARSTSSSTTSRNRAEAVVIAARRSSCVRGVRSSSTSTWLSANGDETFDRRRRRGLAAGHEPLRCSSEDTEVPPPDALPDGVIEVSPARFSTSIGSSLDFAFLMHRERTCVRSCTSR